MNNLTKIFAAPLFAALMFTAGPSLAEGPDDVIRTAVTELARKLEGRKDELSENPEELHALINDILLPRFDRKLAAQLVLARHWREASEEQRSRFIEAYYQSLLERYAEGVLEFDEDQIEILPFHGDTSRNRATVKTVVKLDDGTKVPVDYDLVNRNDEWQIFNVTIEGVSYIRNFRAEIDSEIRSSSLEAVIRRLESRSGGDDTKANDDGSASGQ